MYYPYLVKWVSDRGLTNDQFARICDIDRGCAGRILAGKTENIPKKTIDKILKGTGMKYEYCFAETVRKKVQENG